MRNRRGKFTSVLLGTLLLLQGAAFGLEDSPLWTFRGEFCVEPSMGRVEWDAGRAYVAARVDVRAYESRDLSTRIYASPRVVYNSNTGLDFQFGVSLEWYLVDVGHVFDVLQGAKFPRNFLEDCLLYVRVNLTD